VKVIFETPSKRCPMRRRNGQQVEIVKVLGRHNLRRAKRRVNVYAVVFIETTDSYDYTAFEDELFVLPAR
jgi:hypothetical protein